MTNLSDEARELRNAYHREYYQKNREELARRQREARKAKKEGRKQVKQAEQEAKEREKIEQNLESQRKYWERVAREKREKAEQAERKKRIVEMNVTDVITAQYVLGEALKELNAGGMDKSRVAELIEQARKALMYKQQGRE